MAHTNFKGTVWSENGFGVGVGTNQTDGSAPTTGISSTGAIIAPSITVGTGGTTTTLIQKGTTSVIVPAILAGDEADVTQTIASALAGDAVTITPTNAAMETGLGVVGAWVSASGSVKIRLTNLNAAATLTGSTTLWTYTLTR